jgi:mono/diheme cytochrome c family protein
LPGDGTRYDRDVSSSGSTGRPFVRLVVVPLLLFGTISGTVFALAKLHPAKPGVPAAAAGPVKLGDAARGESVFENTCAGCHGEAGAGGGIGPKLAGNPISLAAAKAQIDNGGGTMPSQLVGGGQEEDVLAYLKTILAGN